MRPDDQQHRANRGKLRTIGLALAVIGGVMGAIGMISFFSAFGGGGSPRYFWCAMVGMPIFAAGVIMLKFGYFGQISRYFANEAAPVAKDTFNYLAEGTKEGVRTTTSAMAEGFSAGIAAGAVGTVECPKCGESNDASAKFCDQCGGTLSVSVDCPKCGKENDRDAKFCDECGGDLSDLRTGM